MSLFPFSKSSLPCFALIVAGSLLVAGCTLDSLLGKVRTDYKLEGTTNDQETADYLKTIMDERLAEKTKTLSDGKDADLRARQEDYIEQTVRADLLKALQARGYYAAAVAFTDGSGPLSGRYDIAYGPQYTISGITVTPAAYAAALPANAPAAGHALNAADVLAAQTVLRDNVGREHCYFDLSVENRVRLDNMHHLGAVDLVVTAGREGQFGPLTIEGNDKVKEAYLRRLVPWKEGDCFRREKLEDFKTALLQGGLFSQAEIILPPAGPSANGSVPIILSLKERAQRSIGAGLTYYSDEGPGGTLSWENRNLLGAAEKLKAALNLSSLKQSLDADFTKPYFLRKDQSLLLNASLRRQDTDAFQELAIDTGGAIERKFNKHLSVSTGINASLLRVDDHTLNTTEDYALLSAPQTLTYDTRDNLLDPHKGVNIGITVKPFVDLLGQADPFLKGQITGSTYLSFSKDSNTVLAAKGGIGAIWGTDIDSVPATERFYAGGGGTVRGYGYQDVGPQKNGDPTGGLSLATLSLELRTKFTDTIGAVAFVDAGSVNEASTPNFKDVSVGAGLGLRYYTSFGPVRFDVATPLTQKDKTSQNYQFYISIGQAF